jgi:hypothetical protein
VLGWFGYDHGKMHPESLITTIVIGGGFIVLGLVPGLFEALKDGIQNFSDSLYSRYPVKLQNQTDYKNLPRQPWLAALGLAAILTGVAAYISN